MRASQLEELADLVGYFCDQIFLQYGILVIGIFLLTERDFRTEIR